MYWVKRPEASLAVAGSVSLACAIFVQPSAFVPCGAIVLTLVLGHVWPWLAMWGLSCELTFVRSRGSEGEPAGVRLRIQNRRPWPVWGLSIQKGFGGTPGRDGETAVALARIGGLSKTEFDWEFVPRCRGVYPCEVPAVTTGFPFGLVRVSRPVSVPAKMIVWPAIMSLEVLLDSADACPSEEFCCENRVGESGDVMGTRAFRQGDALRRVNWALTARHGNLIVSERQSSARSRIRLVLDVHRDVHVCGGEGGTLEWGIRIAASIADCYVRQHAQVECLIGDRTMLISDAGGSWVRFMDELAKIPRNGTACRESKLQGVNPRRKTEGLTFIITTDRRLEIQPELAHPGIQQRVVLMQGSAWRDERPAKQSVCAAHHWLLLNDPTDVAGEFRSKWRRMCHEH
ncbi:MAG: DUF58 domain-containing protein [Planctomycetales bacterium]